MVERGFPLCRRQPTGEQDSGSSAHSGRAGSSPASRTKRKRTFKRTSFFLFVCGGLHLSPNKKGSPHSLHRLWGEKAKALCPRLWMRLRSHWLFTQCFFRCLAHSFSTALCHSDRVHAMHEWSESHIHKSTNRRYTRLRAFGTSLGMTRLL